MKTIDSLMWIVTFVSIIGVVLNIHHRRESFYLWFCTNGLWAIYDYKIGAYSQAALFTVYFGLAVYGIYKWRHKRHE